MSVVPNLATKLAIVLGLSIIDVNDLNLAKFYLKTLTKFILVAGDWGKDNYIELIELFKWKFLTI